MLPNNNASETTTQTGTATGGAGGSLDLREITAIPGVGGSSDGCIVFCFAPGGDSMVSQTTCQQAAQSGAFGSSEK